MFTRGGLVCRAKNRVEWLDYKWQCFLRHVHNLITKQARFVSHTYRPVENPIIRDILISGCRWQDIQLLRTPNTIENLCSYLIVNTPPLLYQHQPVIFTNCADHKKDYTDNTLSSSTLRIGWLSMAFESGNYTDDHQKADKKPVLQIKTFELGYFRRCLRVT